MNEPKRRPGLWWLLFYGRRRRGFPWLLAGLCVAILVLALTFAIPGGADAWRTIAPVMLGVLLIVALAGGLVASVRPRRRRP